MWNFGLKQCWDEETKENTNDRKEQCIGRLDKVHGRLEFEIRVQFDVVIRIMDPMKSENNIELGRSE